MSKLEIEFELTGLKLKIKGEREDVPAAVAAIQRQLGTMMQATGAIANGNGQAPVVDLPAPRVLEARTEEPSNRGKRGPRKASGGVRPKVAAIDFKHDAEKYGFPKQDWSTAKKAMWLLYILTDAGQAEASASQVADTFNKHFKTFGSILSANVLRDLAKEKGKTGWINSDNHERSTNLVSTCRGHQGNRQVD
jgi:hypothetical protein